MQTLTLDADMIMRLTASPDLYKAIAFLERMKNPALSTHLKISKMNCSGCAKKAKYAVALQLSAAFLQLINQESIKKLNELCKLKLVMAKILGKEFDEVRAVVKLANGNVIELKF